jgi:hypothetical protein
MAEGCTEGNDDDANDGTADHAVVGNSDDATDGAADHFVGKSEGTTDGMIETEGVKLGL